MKSTLEVLKEVRATITRETWSDFGLGDHPDEIQPGMISGYTTLCLEGHCCKAEGLTEYTGLTPAIKALDETLRQEFPGRSECAATFNDTIGRKFEDITALLDRTIARLESENENGP